MGLLNYDFRSQFKQGDSLDVIPLGLRMPGEYLAKIDSRDVTLLSTLYIRSIDPGATITAQYFDFTTGGDLGEETLVGSHVQPIAGATDRILLSNAHNKPFLRVIVAGGNVDFSIYGTALNNAGDASIVRENDAALLGVDFANAIAGLDEAGTKWKVVRVGADGSLLVKNSVSGTTVPFISTTTPTPENVPAIDDKIIDHISIRCTIDQDTSNRLEFSIDEGVSWGKLKVGETREEEPRGGMKHIQIRSGAGAVVEYEIYIDFGVA